MMFGVSTADCGSSFQSWNTNDENVYFLMSSLLGVLYNFFVATFALSVSCEEMFFVYVT